MAPPVGASKWTLVRKVKSTPNSPVRWSPRGRLTWSWWTVSLKLSKRIKQRSVAPKIANIRTPYSVTQSQFRNRWRTASNWSSLKIKESKATKNPIKFHPTYLIAKAWPSAQTRRLCTNPRWRQNSPPVVGGGHRASISAAEAPTNTQKQKKTTQRRKLCASIYDNKFVLKEQTRSIWQSL